VTLEQQILNGREGEAAIRAAFRSSQVLKPIVDEGADRIVDAKGNTTIVREPSKQVQGRLSADDEYACYEVCI
jgi:hypothetical protein